MKYIKKLLPALTVMIALFSVFMVYMQIRDSREFYENSYERDFKVRSFQHTVLLYNKVQALEKLLYNKYGNRIIPLEDYTKNDIVIINDMLSELEMFAYAIKRGIYDKQILSSVMGNNIINKHTKRLASVNACGGNSCYSELSFLVDELKQMRK